MWKYSLFLIPIVIISGLYWFGYIGVSWESIRLGKNLCPYYIGPGSEHGGIHMPEGTIFGYETKSDEKLYDIIRDDTFIMSAYFSDDFDSIFKCFRTEELAVAAGYKKFLSDQAGRKKQRLELQEWLNKSPEERKKDCESEGLSKEECSAKLLWGIDAAIGID